MTPRLEAEADATAAAAIQARIGLWDGVLSEFADLPTQRALAMD